MHTIDGLIARLRTRLASASPPPWVESALERTIQFETNRRLIVEMRNGLPAIMTELQDLRRMHREGSVALGIAVHRQAAERWNAGHSVGTRVLMRSTDGAPIHGRTAGAAEVRRDGVAVVPVYAAGVFHIPWPVPLSEFDEYRS